MKDFINGDFGLAKTYWLFGVIGSLVMRFLIVFFAMNGMNIVLLLIIAFGYFIVVWIAVWNSATKYTGSQLWSILAKISVVFGVLGSLAQFNQ